MQRNIEHTAVYFTSTIILPYTTKLQAVEGLTTQSADNLPDKHDEAAHSAYAANASTTHPPMISLLFDGWAIGPKFVFMICLN